MLLVVAFFFCFVVYAAIEIILLLLLLLIKIKLVAFKFLISQTFFMSCLIKKNTVLI